MRTYTRHENLYLNQTCNEISFAWMPKKINKTSSDPTKQWCWLRSFDVIYKCISLDPVKWQKVKEYLN
jgi:hypothetical protein